MSDFNREIEHITDILYEISTHYTEKSKELETLKLASLGLLFIYVNNLSSDFHKFVEEANTSPSEIEKKEIQSLMDKEIHKRN